MAFVVGGAAIRGEDLQQLADVLLHDTSSVLIELKRRMQVFMAVPHTEEFPVAAQTAGRVVCTRRVRVTTLLLVNLSGSEPLNFV